MTRKELEKYDAKLSATGLSFARSVTDGSGNVKKLEDVPWEIVIIKVMQLTGWRIVEEDAPRPTPILKLEV